MSDGSKMCATVEFIKFKPGTLQEAVELTKKLQPDVQAIPGRRHMISVWNDDGAEYVISIWESPEAKAAAASRVDAIGAQFGDIFEEFKGEDFKNVWYIVGK